MTPEQRTRLEEQLREVKSQKIALLEQKQKYQQDNAIEFITTPPRMGFNPPQSRIIQAFEDPRYQIFVYNGGNRAGKTTLGAWLTISIMMGEWPWNGHKIIFPHNKPRKIRVIAQEWEKSAQTVIIPKLHEWWPKNRPVKIRKNTIGVEYEWVDEKTQSRIEIVTNKQDPMTLEGWDGDWLWIDEPIDRKVWIACARGLIDRCGKAFMGMTLLDQAWIQREIVRRMDPETKRPDTSVFSVVATTYDNVGYGISKEEVEKFKKNLTPEEIQARIYGVPAFMSGLVCKNFDRQKHLKERFEIPLDWPVDIAFDVHPRTEQAVLFIATDPRRFRYVCFEIWMHGDGTQIAEQAMRVCLRHGLRVNRTIIDPLAKSDENTGETTFDKIARVLARYGHSLEVASKDKDSGILEINTHLIGPNKEPSLFIFNDLIRTIYEIEGWTYDKDTQKPAKVDDHMVENMYRILLLNTQYTTPEEADWEGDDYRDKINESTGY